jgi:uncharacterized protein (TIGR02117 family)
MIELHWNFRQPCETSSKRIHRSGPMRHWTLFPCLLLLLHGCSTKPDAVIGTEPFSGRGDQAVFVISHGWHTGIALPAQWLTAKIPVLKKRFEGARYLEVGWGDEAFYQSEEFAFNIAARAALWPTDAVVHVVELPVSPESYFVESEVVILCASAAQLHALTAFIERSFARDAGDNIISRQRGIYGNSQFYAGAGDFHLFNTCNKWTANGLQSLGMDINPAFKFTADSIMAYLAAGEGASKAKPTQASCQLEPTGE